jgi:hypothetical protein
MLAALHRLPIEQVLRQIAIDLKPDPTYVSRKTLGSRRWHVLTDRRDFEIPTKASRWYDMCNKRGAEAIDPTLQLLCASFV